MRIRRPLATGAAALAALAVLAGCVAIPTSGGVQTVVLDRDREEVPNVALPEGPTPGAEPVELVRGFLRAGRAPQNNYNVAREYLAPNAEWSGTERVLVTSSALVPVPIDADTVAVTITVLGEVDARGVYTARAPESHTLTYDFVEVDGEQRISRADPGTVLSRNAFETAFAAYPLYFFDLTFRYLVPDLRWFPQTPRGVADRIVSELATGPAGWLASPVLVSAIPTGTRANAAYDAPRVDVDLDPAVRAESPTAQWRMIQQVRASLAALGNLTDIEITAGGLALSPAAQEDVVVESRYQVRELIGGVGGEFGVLAADSVSPLPAIGTRADELEPVAATLARNRQSVAVLGTAGVSIVGVTRDPVLVDARPGLLAPSLDPYGFAWTVPADDPAGLRATTVDGVAHPVPLPVDGRVVSLDVSRDGARLLVSLDTGNGPRVILLGIHRDASLVPVGFGSAFELPVDDPVIDATWLGPTSVAVLQAIDDSTTVDVFPVGGPMVALGGVEGAEQVVGGNEQSGVRVRTGDGVVWRPGSAGGWIALELRASFLGTQQ